VFLKIPYTIRSINKSFVLSIQSLFLQSAIKKDLIIQAKVAHLVEHDLAKVGVAGSSPVFRSKLIPIRRDFFSTFGNADFVALGWWNW
jgi:hypothetical protein